MKINHTTKFFLALFMQIALSTHTHAGISKRVSIKTNIYCDHCKQCESCGGKIEHDLTFDKGIETVKLDEKAMTITVTYNSKKTTPEAIRLLNSKYGFDADDVKADPTAYSKLDECWPEEIKVSRNQ